jgi:hypothetical protein
MSSQRQLVVLLGQLYANKTPSHFVRDQSRCTCAVEAVQNNFSGLREKRYQPAHKHRRQLARVVNPKAVMLQAMYVVPQVGQRIAIVDAQRSSSLDTRSA